MQMKSKKVYATGEPWFAFLPSAEVEGETILRIDGVIGGSWEGGVETQEFADELAAVSTPKLTIHVNSPGGSVFDGLAIYNLLAAWGKAPGRELVAVVDGLAASAASVIVMAASRIVMPESAFLMVHQPWGQVVGNAVDLRAYAGELDQIGETLVDIYAARSGRERDEWRALMDGDDGSDGTFLDAERCAALGVCDEIEENVKAAACIGADMYQNAPEGLLKYSEAAEKRTLETALRDAGYSRKDAAKIAAGPSPRDAEEKRENSVDWERVLNELRKKE